LPLVTPNNTNGPKVACGFSRSLLALHRIRLGHISGCSKAFGRGYHYVTLHVPHNGNVASTPSKSISSRQGAANGWWERLWNVSSSSKGDNVRVRSACHFLLRIVTLALSGFLTGCAVSQPYIAEALEHADRDLIYGEQKDNNALAEQATVDFGTPILLKEASRRTVACKKPSWN
jgi:hypothetical protein